MVKQSLLFKQREKILLTVQIKTQLALNNTGVRGTDPLHTVENLHITFDLAKT